MFSFDCRSRQETALRLLHARSSVLQRSGTEEKDHVGKKAAAAQCLVCRWSASRFQANNRTRCTHCRYWSTTFKPAVDVAPRHHNLLSAHGDPVSLKHPNAGSVNATLLSNTPRALSCGAEDKFMFTHAFSEENSRGGTNPPALLSSRSEPHGKEFRVRFSRANTRRERTTQAQDARDMFHDFPFTDPRPHDHRPLSGTCPSVRTLCTPDPQLIRLRKAALSTSLQTDTEQAVASTQDAAPGSDNGQQFTTTKTPEPKYQQNLWHEKGRYSPAFTAHDAYLARVANSISKRSIKGH